MESSDGRIDGRSERDEKKARNFLVVLMENFVLRGTFLGWAKTKKKKTKQESPVFFCGSSSFFHGKAPFRLTLLIDFAFDLGAAQLKCLVMPQIKKGKKECSAVFILFSLFICLRPKEVNSKRWLDVSK
jgi:hypothetical protein